METEGLRKVEYGGSLPVQNVQALSAEKLEDIPAQYIRPELESDEVSIDESLQIPVVDMAKLVSDQFAGHDQELNKLHLACKDWGFFQLINHGVLDEVIENMKIDIQEFFKLPLGEKMGCAQEPNNLEGYGQAFVVSEEQKLDWGDMLFLLTQPVFIRNLKFWPTNPPSLRATLNKYSAELQKVAICLMRSMGKNLGIDPEQLAGLFENGTQGIRMNYYPACAHANKVIGLAPHSDATGLTLLVQVNEVEGLQIRKNGKWVPVKPLPGAFIINVGDIVEILSNGEYRSIEHRAMVNPKKERLSVAAFHSIQAKVGPLPDLVKEKKPKFKTVTHDEYISMAISNKLDGKHLLDQLKL
ncbi:hypothetical protein SLE2022_090870 [Rubroshorea leprosula]